MTKLLETCAHELMDTAPKIVQSIRIEMRGGHGADLSIPQFRTLRYIQRNPDTSLSDLADHLGLTLPSVSKLVDGLVHKELIIRQEFDHRPPQAEAGFDRERRIHCKFCQGQCTSQPRQNPELSLRRGAEHH